MMSKGETKVKRSPGQLISASDPAGTTMGAVTGYTAGYGLVNRGAIKLSIKAGIAGIGDIGISLGGNDFNLDWSTAAGGSGSNNPNGQKPGPGGGTWNDPYSVQK